MSTKDLGKELSAFYEAEFESRKRKILDAEDTLQIAGCKYYVSNAGDDSNDGKSPQTPWKSLKRVSDAYLYPGDGVLFQRGDVFRGLVMAKAGVTYGAYGTGEKPRFYGGEKSLADPAMWEETDATCHIWKYKEKILEVGTLVFNDGAEHSRKLIPTYRNMEFVCRDDESRPFVMQEQMSKDLDLYWHYDTVLTKVPTKGEDFPIPDLDLGKAFGELYLRCDRGNPGEVFREVEAVSRHHMFNVYFQSHVTLDNLCVKYVGKHGVAAIDNVGLKVTNCEFGWIGGSIQHYGGTDCNYPEGRRGSVTRFGNAIEVYGSCTDYIVENNYIYQVYDAGITHQCYRENKVKMTGIRYVGNVIEKCVYGIEYFLGPLDGKPDSCMTDVSISNNFIRLSGYGWGQQRHNVQEPALIKGWSYDNPAEDFRIHDNIFDRCAYRMLHLVALQESDCPEMKHNVYIQNKGGMLGQYGGKENGVPEMLLFDENAETLIRDLLGDKEAQIYFAEQKDFI